MGPLSNNFLFIHFCGIFYSFFAVFVIIIFGLCPHNNSGQFFNQLRTAELSCKTTILREKNDDTNINENHFQVNNGVRVNHGPNTLSIKQQTANQNDMLQSISAKRSRLFRLSLFYPIEKGQKTILLTENSSSFNYSPFFVGGTGSLLFRLFVVVFFPSTSYTSRIFITYCFEYHDASATCLPYMHTRWILWYWRFRLQNRTDFERWWKRLFF